MRPSALNPAQVADSHSQALASVTAKPSALLNTAQAAEYIGVKHNTLEVWRTYGKSPKFYKVGRLCKYRLSDLDAWLEQQARSSTSQQIEG